MAGKRIRKRAPPLGRFSASMRPPISSTIVLEMARPRPAPRLRPAAAKGSKIFASAPSAIPGPLSPTSKRTQRLLSWGGAPVRAVLSLGGTPASGTKRIEILRCGRGSADTASSALTRRLSSTCPSFAAEPATSGTGRTSSSKLDDAYDVEDSRQSSHGFGKLFVGFEKLCPQQRRVASLCRQTRGHGAKQVSRATDALRHERHRMTQLAREPGGDDAQGVDALGLEQ